MRCRLYEKELSLLPNTTFETIIALSIHTAYINFDGDKNDVFLVEIHYVLNQAFSLKEHNVAKLT